MNIAIAYLIYGVVFTATVVMIGLVARQEIRNLRARNEARNARQRTIRNYRDQLAAFDPDAHRTVQR